MKKIFTLLFVLSFGLLFSNTSKINDDKIVACPTATISYSGSPFCTNTGTPQNVSLTGTDAYTGGVFSSVPVGLALDPMTGAITPSLSTPGSYTVTYTIPSGGSCPDFMATAAVTILGDDQITPTSAFMNQTVCLNQPIINITAATTYATGASATGLPPGVTSAWSSNTITIFGVPTVPGAYNYTIYTTGGNCFPPANYSGTIIVLPSPTATIGSNQTICSGNTAMISFTGTANATVSYTINGGAIQNIVLNSSGFATLSTPPLTSNTVYNLESTSSATGCSSPTSGSAVITVMPNPTMSVSSGSPSICSGESTNITLTSNIPGTTFQWNVVQAGVIGASAGSGNSINHVLTAIGNYTGQVVYNITPTANGCVGTPTTVTINVNPSPIVTPSPPGDTINSGDTTNIVLTSNVSGTTFTWTVFQSNAVGATSGVGNIINQQISLMNTTQSGTVDYIITPNVNGCTGAPIYVTVNVSPNLSANSFNSQDFLLSPNPVTDILNIKNNQIINKVTAFNQLGQMVLERNYNNNEVQLDFSGLKTGIYFISVESDKKQSTFKIVKN
ncbi:hypothetical protein FSS13T_21090 [Flavobacterium saliperosum S13]|uniref:Por secretion system C-terminal sorting domain-containing protein n=2 Tax=Flavobacterium saliperosum TaxID=329186 RepID=A0A1G4VQZ5_9FLAO|nr:PKD-like domain-containing protein [Flavobacterium saliperosum]ESU24136.1 hypothetical protein FSS13T_21090 [Flavobacterium saliperosum S13]SCX10550.1 Por secretion system C-terminal sorting domain-containing protein [Flavobacterium saliperosum]